MDFELLRQATGIFAGALAFAAFLIYVSSIVSKKTRPSRVTWWVLFIGSGILTLSYWQGGARETIWLPVAYTLAYFITALLSVKYGDGSPTLSDFDRVCAGGAIASVSLWWLTSNPLIALTLQMAIEAFGLVPTLRKTYADPLSESALAWGIATLASVVNLIAIDAWTYAIASYPIFVLLTNVPIFLLAARVRKTFAL